MKYYSILTDNFNECYVCKCEATDIHHILHGADKKLSEEHGLMIPLCRACHSKVHFVGGELDNELKQLGQREFLIKTFGKCYL